MTFNEWWEANIASAANSARERTIAEAAWHAGQNDQDSYWLPIESAPWDVEVQICYICPENGPRVAIAKHDKREGWRINSGWSTIGVKGAVTHWRLPPPTPSEV